jgi:hypothetical protein
MNMRCSRLVLVGLLPNATLVLIILALTASGAPADPPSLQRLLVAIDNVTLERLASVLALVLIVSMIVQSFQFSLVRLLEGYWDDIRVGRWFSAIGKHVHQRRRQRLEQLMLAEPRTPEEERRQQWAEDRLSQYPAEDRLLPTRLGNTLRAAEDEAGQRYGLPTIAAMPRLYPYLSERLTAVFSDRRNQLDVAVRFCTVLALAAAIAAVLLLPNGGRWRLLPLGIIALAWISYKAAVRAAASYGQALFVAFDLHRFDMIRALHYPLPNSRAEELAFNERLSDFLTMGVVPDDEYQHGQQADIAPTFEAPDGPTDSSRTRRRDTSSQLEPTSAYSETTPVMEVGVYADRR